ncbi:MAG: PD-(D/E)XK nuclease family protein, partial [Spirochaetes bacterium]|nr:PD-(D/E)XK nuclease family protein [Spirochaetota bacterium]
AREFVEPYENAREARRKETANLLYVAATRAKQRLTILLRGNKDGVTKGFSNLLEEASKISIDEKIESRAQKIKYGWTCQYEPAPDQSTEEKRRGKKILPPLRIEPLTSSPVQRELDPVYFSSDVEGAIARGNRIHQVLSKLTSDGQFLSSALVEKEEQETIRKFLAHPEVREILFRPGRVYTEQHLSNTDTFGIVDRLIISTNRITLIDYKTGYRIPELLVQYRAQMERYRMILTTLFPHRSIEAYLLFVDDAKNPVEKV